MKRIYLLFATVAILASCNTKKDEPREPEEIKIEETIVADNTHNAQTSLDYVGTYKGTLPTASGSGMEVTVTLTDSTFQKTISYVGKSDKPIETKGKYTWDETGFVITLEGEDAPNKYFVGENTLYHLDMDGKKIEGELAPQYILNKQ